MWRILDSIVSLGALALSGYAISAGADPMYAIVIAATIISGPKAMEWVLVREDVLQPEDTTYFDDDE